VCVDNIAHSWCIRTALFSSVFKLLRLGRISNYRFQIKLLWKFCSVIWQLTSISKFCSVNWQFITIPSQICQSLWKFCSLNRQLTSIPSQISESLPSHAHHWLQQRREKFDNHSHITDWLVIWFFSMPYIYLYIGGRGLTGYLFVGNNLIETYSCVPYLYIVCHWKNRKK